MKKERFAELLGAVQDTLAHAKGQKQLRTRTFAVSHLTMAQAARFKHVTNQSVIEAVETKRLPSIKVQGKKMIAVADLTQWKPKRVNRRKS